MRALDAEICPDGSEVEATARPLGGLEAAYARAKELALRLLGDGALQQLHDLRVDVRELRNVWRAEVVHALHVACMALAITIRDVPSATRDELAARAARSGRSLQEYLLAEINELAARPDPSDVIARARERLRSTGARVDVEVILAARDAERR